MRAVLISAMISWVIAGGGAFAGDRMSATIDVNIRSGPGANYPIVEILHAGETVATRACPGANGWCNVVAPGGGEGWISAKFLSPVGQGAPAPSGSTAASAPPSPSTGNIDTTTTSAVPSVGAPSSLILPEAVRKYVATHRPLSVDLSGEPAVGASVPADVRLRDIPGSRYQYVYVQGRPVFVDAQTRRIVKVEP
jgi:uncharacterized protein YraI